MINVINDPNKGKLAVDANANTDTVNVVKPVDNTTVNVVNPIKKYGVDELLNETTPLTEEQKTQASLDADAALAARDVTPTVDTEQVVESPIAPNMQDENGPVDVANLEATVDVDVLAARERIKQDQSKGITTPQEILDIAGVVPDPIDVTPTVETETDTGLDATQIKGLDSAAQREAMGSANADDLANLRYAEEHFGYEAPNAKDAGVDSETRTVTKNVENSGQQMLPSDTDPVKAWDTYYQNAYITSGAPTNKKRTEELAGEIRDMEDLKDEEIRDINDNPWMTEGVRLREIAKIDNKYSDKLNNLTNQYSLQQNMYNAAVQNAQFTASQGLKLNMWQKEFDQTSAFKLAEMAQKAADAKYDNLEWGVVAQKTDPMTGNTINQYGFIDKTTGEIVTTSPARGGDYASNSGYLSDTNVSSYLGEYDITTYATDPEHENKVNRILNNMGTMDSVQEMDDYIQAVAPGSEVTGQMIANASAEHGVPWEMTMAMMQQDSSFATAGTGARNNNPGNIGQYDGLTAAVPGFASMQAGVSEVAGWLDRHRGATRTTNPTVAGDSGLQFPGLVAAVEAGTLEAEKALTQVPQFQRDKLAAELAAIPPKADNLQDQIAQEKADLATSLKTHKGLDSSVGPTEFGRKFFSAGDRFGPAQDFIASVDQLVSDLSLESLITAKSRGATFGALSDNEMRILASAATKIGTWTIKDPETLVISGYNVDEKSFKAELDKISTIFNRAIKDTEGLRATQQETREDGLTDAEAFQIYQEAIK